MPTFIPTERRLVLRYREGRAFSLSKIQHGADNEGLMDLATAIGSIQEEAPRRVSTVLTRRLA